MRPARFIELFLISKTCTRLPYGLVMLVPLSLKFAAGFLICGLLRDLRVPTPWPEVGTALWLLEPVGTEAALWPAALHVLLGLVLAPWQHFDSTGDDRSGWAALATLGAALSVEQVIFALPLAVWLTAPREHRRRATSSGSIGVMTIGRSSPTPRWPGHDPRIGAHARRSLAEHPGEGQNGTCSSPRRDWDCIPEPSRSCGHFPTALAWFWVGALSGALLFARLLRDQTTPASRI